MPSPGRQIRQLVILGHRYLGIPLSLLFVAWFASGIVMMYTNGMPADSNVERLSRSGAIPLGEINVSPGSAARTAGILPGNASIRGMLNRPVYRFGDGIGADVVVFADSGELFEGADRETGAAIIANSLDLPEDDVQFVRTLSSPDQWTLTLQGSLPLHRYDIADDARSYAYVSVATGDIVLVVDRTDRVLAWAGAIPHWFYFTPLRTEQPTWYWTIVWTSLLGCVVAALGLILAVTQFRMSSPFRLKDSIRYRGWMRWHYYTGALFGIFTFTWIVSGLLSMEPFDWMNRRGLDIEETVMTDGPFDIGDFDNLVQASWHELARTPRPVELQLLRIQGGPRLAATFDDGHREYYDPDTLGKLPATLDTDSLLSRLTEATGEEITDASMLDQYDSYYYDRASELPLPVLRVKFADPSKSWVYVDPMTGKVIRQSHREARLERWLFNGLHSLDFAFLLSRRPLWDIVVIILSLGGLASSAIGLVLGWRRIRAFFGRRAAR
jgi:hypothetical protein